MKEVWNCYLCNSVNIEVLFSNKYIDPYYQLISGSNQEIQVTWVQCKECSFTFRVQQLGTEELIFLYNNYRNGILSKEAADQYFDRKTKEKDEDYQLALELEEMIKKYIGICDRNYLDIGAGAGIFIYYFNQINKNWRLHAVETTPAFAEVIENK